ncbi:hypothetical protein [Actinomadura litoris]|uniref:Uncharacterized protein n=1 Tax=Actinomadura litoris TaxID=2678616 RepID=A0A7K1LB30_9ACTN|nr:hypothetical protein [Actinomadura litoris]MUN41456.1 hypothetical protein [Actinomadura litoris]
MGYDTDFTGKIQIEPPLNPSEISYLRRFSDSRRMHRDTGPYYLGNRRPEENDTGVVDPNSPPPEQPGLWCDWVPTPDGTAIEWNRMEKFYYATEWMEYLINAFLSEGADVQAELKAPIVGRFYPPEFAEFTFDHVLSGTVEAQGDDPDDRWDLVVSDNEVQRVEKG